MSNGFSFNISLSVLNHLGRNLYRSFITVLGEAISNSWDADARNVWITIDRKNNCFTIVDDGIGMDSNDFQQKFLKIGYSKRKYSSKSKLKRPFIGRKGIGKLALLSCAERITVISRKDKSDEYIGGVIDNSGLDKAIKEDLIPNDYPLEVADISVFEGKARNHGNGTMLHFQDVKKGVKNKVDYLRKVIALYFRFSLLDKNFNIYINTKLVTLDDLNPLADKTEFLWEINTIKDPFVQKKLNKLKEKTKLRINNRIKGFIASVEKPSNLKILTADEDVSVDLFVNGRLREKNILKHIPTNRLVESYIYGQIHINSLESIDDKFTSSREGIVIDDSSFQKYLDIIKKEIITKVTSDWDKWRLKHRKPGDPENKRITKRNRKSRELFNEVAKDYKGKSKREGHVIDKWVDSLEPDAEYNFSSYAECFIGENLLRKFISHKNIKLPREATQAITKWKKQEEESKNKGNISIEIRRKPNDLSYLDMAVLANTIDKGDPNKQAGLFRDAKEYKPMRDAMSHTAVLSDLGKAKLTGVYENLKARLRKLFDTI